MSLLSRFKKEIVDPQVEENRKVEKAVKGLVNPAQVNCMKCNRRVAILERSEAILVTKSLCNMCLEIKNV